MTEDKGMFVDVEEYRRALKESGLDKESLIDNAVFQYECLIELQKRYKTLKRINLYIRLPIFICSLICVYFVLL